MVHKPLLVPLTVAGEASLDATVVSAPSAGAPKAPTRLGRYALLDRLGVGGMAEVYLAEQIGAAGFHKRVVVKRILPHLAADQQFVQMFAREAKVAARVSHPNVVQIYELAEEGGEFFIAMEHIDGLTLHRLAAAAWEQMSAVPTDVVIRTIADAALGLHAAHSLTDELGRLVHLVHRDVSPDNLMVSKDGVTKVLDFGIAKGDLGGPKTKTGNLRGKIPFMPPEQIRGEILDARADIYALGVSAYWMLTGERPSDRQSDWHTMHAILHDVPKPPSAYNPAIPAGLDQLLLRMLHKDRDQRPSSGKEVADILEEFASASSHGGKKTTVAFLNEILPLTGSHGNPVSEVKPTMPPRPPPAPGLAAAGAAPAPAPAPALAAAEQQAPAAAPFSRTTLPFVNEEETAAPRAVLETLAPKPPQNPDLPLVTHRADIDVAVIKPVTLPAGVNAISDVLNPPKANRWLVPLIALILVAAIVAAIFIFVVIPTITAPTDSPPKSVADAGTAAAKVDAGVVVVGPPAVRAVKSVDVRGAPDRIRWTAGGVVLGVGSGRLTVPEGTKTLTAEDLRRGLKVDVPLVEGVADYSALPTGTVQLVRTSDKIKVTLGSDDISVQRKLKLVVGRYRIKIVRGNAVRETTIEVLAGKEQVLDVSK